MRWGPRARRSWAAALGTAASALLASACGPSTSPATPASPTDASGEPLVLSAPVLVDRGGIDAGALLAPSTEAVLEEGATPLQVLATGAATEGDRIGGFVAVQPHTCLVAYARGTSDIEDLDVLTFDDDGTSLIADQSIRPNPAVVVCPPHPERIYVTARVASGQGLVALGVHSIAPEQAPALAIKLGARMSASESEMMTREAWPGLSKRIEQRREELSGRWMMLRRLSLPVSPRAESYVSVPLPAASCLDVLVMPNEETRGLRVEIADETGLIIARGADRGEDRVALVCSPVDTTVTIGIRPRRGHGLAAVILSRSEAGAETELAIRPDARRVGPMQSLDVTREQVAARLAQGGYGARRVVGQGRLEIGNTVLHRARLSPGCTRLDVLAGRPVTGVRASLWVDDALWASTEGGEQTTLWGCTNRAVEAEVEVEAHGQPGPHVVEARAEARPAPVLRNHPLAAARLMARANAGQPVPAAALEDLHVVDLDAQNRGTQSFPVPAGTCKTVVAALGPGASGITLQLVDTRHNTVAVTNQGAYVASARVCSDDVPMLLQARLVAGTGTTSALFGTLRR